MSTKIQVRRGSSTDWSNANPILAVGEIGYDTTVGKFKIGDGLQTWNLLKYTDGTISNGVFSGTLSINTGADTNQGLIIKRNSGNQSANLLEVTTSTGTALGGFNSYGGLFTPSLQNTGFTTAGVVTNNQYGFLSTNTALPAIYGGTGNAYVDRTVVAQASMTSAITGSTTAGTVTSAFQSSGTDKYVSLDASSAYYFEAFMPIVKAASTTASAFRIYLIYKNASTGADIQPSALYMSWICLTGAAVDLSGTIYGTGVNTATSVTSTNTGTLTRYLRVVGYLLTNTTAAKMTIGFDQSVNASSGAPTTTNNYMSVYKLTTSSTTLNGAWV